MFIDTHCHLFYEDLKSDLDLVLERAKKMGVCRFICVGTNLKDSAQSLKLANQYDPIYATVGIHPHDAKDFNLSYLEESKHIGNTKYIQTNAGFNFNNGLISLGAKRNLLTNSAEFYDLSYEYINDCLTAGVAFRREFYRDRDIEPDDSLIFKVTFSPLGTISTPEY